MRKIEATDTAAGPHGEAFGQLNAGVLLCVEELPEGALLGVIGAGGITGRRPDAAVLLFDEVLVRQLLVPAIAPFFTDAFVQVFGKGLGQTVGQGFGQDGVVIVVIGFELLDQFLQPVATGDGEGTQIIARRDA